MANPGPKGGSGRVLAQATSDEELKRGTKRPAEVADLDQEDPLKPTPAKLQVWAYEPESSSTNTLQTFDKKAVSLKESGVSPSESGKLQSSLLNKASWIPPSEPGQLLYCLVSVESEVQPALAKLRERSEEHPFLTVDCKGEELSRRGKLSIVSVATHSHTYLFDIKTLGAKVFDEGLREILEDPGREKLMFDCRQDSDCLWHLYQVRLANVLDLQLLQVIKFWSGQTPSTKSRVKAYRKCLYLYVCDNSLLEVRDEGDRLLRSEIGTEWMKRPLDEILLKYATVDVQGFFPLYDKLKSGLKNAEDKTRLQRGSQKYLNLFREIRSRTYSRSENNSYLPKDVL